VSVDSVAAAAEPEEFRRLMFSIAYRMVGSATEAEDIVQEAFLRYYRTTASGTSVASPKSFLTTVTTNLAIDQLKSARVRRETYVGVWLPEPLVGASEDPAARAELADSLSFAFLVLLETLSPVERAVFLLREIFEYGYGEVAGILHKSEDNCRQILARAKKRIEERSPRFHARSGEHDELAARFFGAVEKGDVGRLVEYLAPQVAFYGDGGGKANAYPRPVLGRDRVFQVLASLARLASEIGARIEPVVVNGQPGALGFDAEGRLVNVLVLDIADGAIQAVRSVVNPDKLDHLGYPLSMTGRIGRQGS
jgi:RNA polymerase sigma-70 factor (ECF subfamily)